MSNFVDAKGSADVGGGAILGDISENCKAVVVGVDLGTAYSGIAFAYKADPGSIYCSAPSAKNYEIKAPTVLLHEPNGTWSFGNQAWERYSSVLDQHIVSGGALPAETRTSASLFRRFKMDLKDRTTGFESIKSHSMNNGQTKGLMELIVTTLRILKEFTLQKVNDGYGTKYTVEDIQWVLTVPAIWNEFGKAFMRKAAFRAGMMDTEQSDNLLLVLEPEAASLAVQVAASAHNLLLKGSKFLILDCGGGTVDITAHEVNSEIPLTLNSISTPAGGDWGSEYVNKKFKEFLQELLNNYNDTKEELYKEHELPYDYHQVDVEFEKIKLSFTPENDPLPISIGSILEGHNLETIAKNYNQTHASTPIKIIPRRTANGQLAMSKELMLSFYEPMLSQTINTTRDVIASTQGISHIMVVGGFATSEVLKQRIRQEFEHGIHGKALQVIIPNTRPNPQAAIAHGAVYYGLYQGVICNRIASFTYGVEQYYGEHDQRHFTKLITRGELLPIDHEVEIVGIPVREDQTRISWHVYRSEKEDPKTCEGEFSLGIVYAECPRLGERTTRRQRGRFKFGGAEIRVEIINAQGERFQGEVSMT